MGKTINTFKKFYKILILELNLINNTIYFSTFLLLGIGIFITIKFFAILSKSLSISTGAEVDMALTGQVGDYIGGIIGTLFAFISIILLFITFRNQRFAFSKERFEDRFFEMIRIYRENVNEMEIISPFDQRSEEIVRGRKVFKELHRLYVVVFAATRDYCANKKIPIDKEFELPNLVYLLIFFGCEDIFNKSIVNNYTTEINSKYGDLLKNLVQFLNKGRYAEQGKLFKLNGIHESFGHYYRHLYHSIRYIHTHRYMTDKEKYEYIRLFRAQIGDFEQAVFFYNSLSILGSKWERAIKDQDNKLISTYKLIKNIPEGTLLILDPKEYYPEVFKE